MSESSTRPDITQRLLAICGITGPILYTILVITLGFLEPGYSHITQTMSELGAVGAQYANIMNTAVFPLSGLLIFVFAFRLHRDISNGKYSKIGPTLIAVSGAALVMTGIFRCDPGCEDITTVGTTHSIFATIAAIPMIFGALAISPRLKRDNRWHDYAAYSLITVVVAVASSILFVLDVFEPWVGVLQRISMGVMLLWIEVMSIKLLRLS